MTDTLKRISGKLSYRDNAQWRLALLRKIRYPANLPIVDKKAAIIQAIRENQVVIITGETGSGKTSQIPKMCLDAGRGKHGMIGCTQPRRVAAISVAQRIAEEMGEGLGFSVGYKIRFDDKTSRSTKIKIMTDGILLMEAQNDRNLSAYDTIIVDEAHERSLNIDFILGILKTLLRKRKNLKVVITSATIDSEKFSRVFDGAPVIEVSGRTYPVDVFYWPSEQNGTEGADLSDPEAAAMAVDKLRKERHGGDILIFMPTERDVRETSEILKGKCDRGTVILLLFARLPWPEQRRVFQPAETQRIIVATNIAETSITIPGIRYVIDTGSARIAHYNSRTRTDSLPVRGISRSSADQRKGRCGRVAHGFCIRLYSEEEYNNRPQFTPPEIMRSNLAGVILKMLFLRLGDIASFPFIDPPPNKSIQDGLDILRELGAIRRGANDGSLMELTENGRLMAQIPLDPRLSRMIIEANKEGCLEEITIIAAALSIQDPRERPAEKEEAADKMQAVFKDPSSDLLTLLNIWNGFQGQNTGKSSRSKLKKYCREHFLSYRRMREWQDLYEQIRDILREQKLEKKHSEPITDYKLFYAAVHKSVLSGYLSNIAVKKEKNIYQATKGREIMLFPGSGLFGKGGPWIVATEIVETSRTYGRICANIESEWLEELGGDLCRSTYSESHWEKNRGEVAASEQVTLFGLVIVPRRFVSYGPIAPDEAQSIFIRQALLEGEVKFPFPFLRHNQCLIENIAAMEDRIRRADLLATDEAITQFYEARLPGVYDIRTLRKLIKDRGGDSFLRMQEKDVLSSIPDPDELALYPEELIMGDKPFPLTYRFAPGNMDDGVTVKIPVHLLPVLEPGKTDWLVPGLLREKIICLLKGLPKEHRKRLLPLNAACNIIMKEMKDRDGHFLSALANFIYQRFGVEIPASAWPVDRVPEYLHMRFVLVDEKDREVAAGRDLSLLQNAAMKQATLGAFEACREKRERDGLTDWDFGFLPEEINLTDNEAIIGVAYPALSATAASVQIRLFLNKEEGIVSHREGVIALYLRHFSDRLKYLQKSIVLNEEMKLWVKHLGGTKAIEAAIIKRVIKNLCDSDIRTPEAFRAHASEIQAKMLLEGQAVRKAILPTLKAYHDTSETMRSLEGANRANSVALQFLCDLKNTLAGLVAHDFIENYPAERFAHLPRYLRALTLGAQRGLLHLGKAMEKTKDVQSLADDLQNTINELGPFASGEKRKALDEYFWMIEEYRVSLFAQELKTPFPVSRKRLDEKIRELKRMF